MPNVRSRGPASAAGPTRRRGTANPGGNRTHPPATSGTRPTPRPRASPPGPGCREGGRPGGNARPTRPRRDRRRRPATTAHHNRRSHASHQGERGRIRHPNRSGHLTRGPTRACDRGRWRQCTPEQYRRRQLSASAESWRFYRWLHSLRSCSPLSPPSLREGVVNPTPGYFPPSKCHMAR
jgi:hypothetical protein